jgi:cobalt transporter subunit CbtA
VVFRIVLTAIVAGLVAGLFVTGVQALRVVPLILEAETYEQAARASHRHGEATRTPENRSHAHEGPAPAGGWERTGFAFLANFLTATAYAALLASAFTLHGRPVSPAGAVAWSLGGFAAFSFIPSLGLPPELPGMAAGDLAARQLWWWSSVVANCAGLAALAFAPRRLWKLAGGVAILLPHVVGAPHPDVSAGAGRVPAELAAHFAVASLGTSLLFWLVLGLCAAFAFARIGERRARARATP